MNLLRIISIIAISLLSVLPLSATTPGCGQSCISDSDTISKMSDSRILEKLDSVTGAYEDIPLLERALKIPTLSDAEKERCGFLLEMAKKNRPGTIVPNFIFKDANGESHSLHETLKGKKTILLFYDPDCDHCLKVIDQLSTLNLPESSQIVAIDAEEDEDLWRENLKIIPDKWSVGFATDPIQDTELFIFMEMPTIYLIDKDLKIILKDATVEKAIPLL